MLQSLLNGFDLEYIKFTYSQSNLLLLLLIIFLIFSIQLNIISKTSITDTPSLKCFMVNFQYGTQWDTVRTVY